MNKRYFHTFDALRFFAFVKVLLLHLPIYAFPWFNFIKEGGGIGVQFFFVLSGFLISYLILEEKTSTDNFNLKNFFVRRILRIWPLYFLMVAVAYATPVFLDYLHISYSNLGYKPDWKFSVFFLENYKIMLEDDHPNVSPLVVMWSLCVEEHFYIVWGLLMYFLSVKAFPKIVFASVVISIVCRKISLDYGLRAIDLTTHIDLFAIGGMLAYFIVTKKEIIESAINSIRDWKKYTLIIIVIFTVTFDSFLFNNYAGKILQPTIIGILFTLLLAIFIPSQSTWKIGASNLLSRWGKISYGLYMIHTIIINMLLKIFSMSDFPLDNAWYAVAFVLVTLFLTILFSQLSYKFIEKPFLNFKKYFYKSEVKGEVKEGLLR